MRKRLFLLAFCVLTTAHCRPAPAVSNIHLSLKLPDGYHLLLRAKPTFTLYTEKGKVVRSFPLTSPEQTFTVPVRGLAKHLKAVAKVFYCPAGKEGLCIIHKATFSVDLERKNTELHYTLPEDL